MDNVSAPVTYHLRKATLEDVPALQELINLSVRTLHTTYYTPDVITSALNSVYGVDTTILSDGHYFAISPSSSPTTMIACGGWSRRATLYGGDQFSSRDPTFLDPSKDAAKIRAMFVHPEWTRKGVGRFLIEACERAAWEAGFRKVEMGATLSGVPFYESMGYVVIEKQERDLGDGVTLELRRMGKELG
jgi:GNAT superfamily N-acetyltransferase